MCTTYEITVTLLIHSNRLEQFQMQLHRWVLENMHLGWRFKGKEALIGGWGLMEQLKYTQQLSKRHFKSGFKVQFPQLQENKWESRHSLPRCNTDVIMYFSSRCNYVF